jgi:hypothetical protein
MGFDLVVVGGVDHRQHDDTPCSNMLSIRHGSRLLGSSQCAGTGGVEEGQSSVCVRSSERKYPFPYHKRKTIVFMVSRKKSNNEAHAQEIAGDEGRYGTRKGTC